MAKKIIKQKHIAKKAEEKSSKERKQVLTRIIQQTNEHREYVWKVEFQIPEVNSGWIWLGTMPTREKAKRIAQMCKDGNL
jgi:hypothetical protein